MITASGAEQGDLRGSANRKLKARKKFLGLLAQADIKLLALTDVFKYKERNVT